MNFLNVIIDAIEDIQSSQIFKFQILKLTVNNYTDNLAASVPVDILPGEFDPSNYNLPRQPLNSCLFSLSSKFSTFNRVSSPHSCTYFFSNR